MCTRLGIAASLVADPPLLLWDEPTAGLDPSARRFTLELQGAAEDVRRLAHEVTDLEGIDALANAGRMLLVKIADGRSRSRSLAEILKLIDESNLSLQAIHSGQNATENAYLQLLQEDKAHGFHR